MEGARRAGDALADDLVFLSTRIAIMRASFDRCDDLLGGVGQLSAAMIVRPDLRQDLLALLDVGAFEAHDQRHLEARPRAPPRRRPRR